MRLVHRRLIGGSVGLLAGLLLAVPAQAETTVTFNFTGAEQVFKVPTGVSSVHVEAIGAAGASVGTVPGGLGGFAAADVSVIPGQLLYIEVGGIGGSPTATMASAGRQSQG